MISFQNKFSSHILLYHSILENNDNTLIENLHNVTPEDFYQQIIWLKKYFDFISVDELSKNYQTGKCAVTFDDGYNSVFENAAPILEEHKIPYAVYINGASFENKLLWRDKIRSIIQIDLIDTFLDKYPLLKKEFGINKSNFFWQTKNPKVPSDLIDNYLNDFFKLNSMPCNNNQCINNINLLGGKKYLTIGNHTFSHYILSSVNSDIQKMEIAKNHNFIKGLGMPFSKLFSVPNGLYIDFNLETRSIISNLGYTGVLLSQNRTNYLHPFRDESEMIFLHRFLVPEKIEKLKKILRKMEINRMKWTARKYLKSDRF